MMKSFYVFCWLIPAMLLVERPNVALAEQTQSFIVLAPAIVKEIVEKVATIANTSPEIESTTGFKALERFCEDGGKSKTIIVISTVSITPLIADRCQENDITDIFEAQLGFISYILVQKSSDPPLKLDTKTIYLSTAKLIPSNDRLIENQSVYWSDLDSNLPRLPIKLLLPPRETPMRRVFDFEALVGGCRKFDLVNNIYSAETRLKLCTEVRDANVVEYAGGEALLQALKSSDAGAVSIFPITILQKNRGWLRVVPLDEFEPTPTNIIEENYLLTLPVYIYTNAKAVTDDDSSNAAKKFVTAVLSEAVIGDQGYLVGAGLVAMPKSVRDWQRRLLD